MYMMFIIYQIHHLMNEFKILIFTYNNDMQERMFESQILIYLF